MSGGSFTPKESQLNLYNPLWAFIVNNFEHLSSNFAGKYASDKHFHPFNFAKL